MPEEIASAPGRWIGETVQKQLAVDEETGRAGLSQGQLERAALLGDHDACDAHGPVPGHRFGCQAAERHHAEAGQLERLDARPFELPSGKPLAPETVRRPQHGLAHHRRCRRDFAPPLEHDLHVGAAVRAERLERRGDPVRRHLSGPATHDGRSDGVRADHRNAVQRGESEGEQPVVAEQDH